MTSPSPYPLLPADRVATAREIFDTVEAHLLKQNAVAEHVAEHPDNRVCVYRASLAPDAPALACAFGCLLTDDEAQTVPNRKITHMSAEEMPARFREHKVLLSLLQSIHDMGFPETWATQLTRLRKERGLDS